MRAYVFTDKALTKDAGRFVWLSVDTEKAQNAAFVEKFPIESWPTLLVLDPSGQTPVLKWEGSATVPQLEKLFDDADRALVATNGAGNDPESLLAQADRANAERKYEDAAALYEKAVQSSQPSWERRNRAIESLTIALYETKAYGHCAEVGVKHVPNMPRGPSFANATAMSIFCAMEESSPEGKAAVAKLAPYAEEALTLPGLLADDRSGLYQIVAEIKSDSGDEVGAKKVASEWLKFVLDQQKAAPNPEARAAFDSNVVLASQKLGQPELALPSLQASERDLPSDYNAAARLALVYRDMGKFQESLAASDRALQKVYGPRKIAVLDQKAQTYVKMGDKAQARKTFGEAIAAAKAITPPTAQTEHAQERIGKELADLDQK